MEIGKKAGGGRRKKRRRGIFLEWLFPHVSLSLSRRGSKKILYYYYCSIHSLGKEVQELSKESFFLFSLAFAALLKSMKSILKVFVELL